MVRSCIGSIGETANDEMTNDAGARRRPASATAEAVDALLVIGRAKEALKLVDVLAAQEPDSFEVHLLRARCLLLMRSPVAAEKSWRRAAELQPEHPNCAIVGVRCAILLQLGEQIWERAERLLTLIPIDPVGWYWGAVAAAHTQRDEIAYERLKTLQRLDPVGQLPLQAAGEIDLVISWRKRKVALVAEKTAETLLGQDPSDPYAHDLRVRAASLREAVARRKRPAAALVLSYVTDAARAGVQPTPGKIRDVMIQAMGPLAPTGGWLLIMFLGAPLLNSVDWSIAFACALSVGTVVYVAGWRRVSRVAAKLPAAGRTRLLRPVVNAMYGFAIAIGAIFVILLLVLHPFTQSHAISLGLGSDSKKHTEFVTSPSTPAYTIPVITFPVVHTFPSFAPITFPTDESFPALPTIAALPTFPPIPTIPPIKIPSFPGIPYEVTVTTPADPELAWQLMRYYTASSGSGLILAAALAFQARRLSRRK